ncbi:uncharacterized protein Z519_02157 [Cladophialophora bantiana CBS 173.52]|uniref:Uncharacterized protein n=1 Tax=Cladophialophora bantiana (strain ATCC 10958 / CBS 173.52 / CDC B-1940 / NIH 8579) TaxID=1442370 RepID=A0A0D2F3D2_CLAB1|nr:uncharacterized protein Z519_02157 [Cladophialophora bantiana CBS 173.52]KIW96766.1 hypothetical protein Z519_02157 [Cladophialophora bantiana CBS 173.52]
MARHQRKDEEAGGEGLGVVETRKKLWRDASGNIVCKRPSQRDTCRPGKKRQPTNSNALRQQNGAVDVDYGRALSAEPLSPPRSMLSGESMEQLSHQLPELPNDPDFIAQTSGPDMFGFLANSSWGIQSSSMNTQMDAPFNEIFNPDTGGKISVRIVLDQN